MSIFNFRRGGPDKAQATGAALPKVAPESVEVVRKRARERLIGSAVLVLLGVVGFPLLFETQPRPVPVDLPIDIPNRTGVKPASPVPPVIRAEPPQVQAPAPEPSASETRAQAVPAQASLHEQEEIVESKPAPASSPAVASAVPAATKPDAKKDARPEAKADARHDTKSDSKSRTDDGQRAKALLEGSTSTADARAIVQVGAFADAAKVREVRAKLEKAGLKTYTQVIDTKDGKRTRVRVGPYPSKAEADKAAAKIKSLDLPASVLNP